VATAPPPPARGFCCARREYLQAPAPSGWQIWPLSLFRTAKYRPEFPAKGFADLHGARQ